MHSCRHWNREVIIMTGCAGNEPYALRVLGNSMQPEFEEGEVIIIEPGQCVDHGAYVIAFYNGEYIFRQIFVKERRLYLRPLNDAYPTFRIDDENIIKGRIISKSPGKGRQMKSYL